MSAVPFRGFIMLQDYITDASGGISKMMRVRGCVGKCIMQELTP
jgi:hypothetical protein